MKNQLKNTLSQELADWNKMRGTNHSTCIKDSTFNLDDDGNYQIIVVNSEDTSFRFTLSYKVQPVSFKIIRVNNMEYKSSKDILKLTDVPEDVVEMVTQQYLNKYAVDANRVFCGVFCDC